LLGLCNKSSVVSRPSGTSGDSSCGRWEYCRSINSGTPTHCGRGALSCHRARETKTSPHADARSERGRRRSSRWLPFPRRPLHFELEPEPPAWPPRASVSTPAVEPLAPASFDKASPPAPPAAGPTWQVPRSRPVLIRRSKGCSRRASATPENCSSHSSPPQAPPRQCK